MVPGKLVPGKNGPRKNDPREKWSPEKWPPGKRVPGKLVPGKNGPRKNGPRKNGPRKIGARKNGPRSEFSGDQFSAYRIYLECSTGHILDVSVNANSFCIQCSVMASAALTSDRVLHYLPHQVKFYSLSFHLVDIKRLFHRNELFYYLERRPFTEYVSQSTT